MKSSYSFGSLGVWSVSLILFCLLVGCEKPTSSTENIAAQPLKVVSISPKDQAENVSPDSKITITFNRALDPSSISPASIVFRESSSNDTSIPGTFEYLPESFIVTFIPDTPFQEGSSYIVSIQKILLDAEGNRWTPEYPGDGLFNFSIGWSVLTADLTDAQSITITKGDLASFALELVTNALALDLQASLFPSLSLASSLATPTSELVKVSSQGTVSRILNLGLDAFHIQKTTNYFIVSGKFLKVKQTTADSEPINCYLIAIPKSANNAEVKCLSEGFVGTYLGFYHPDIGDSYGFSTRSDIVYFVSIDNDTAIDQPISQSETENFYLKKWAENDSTVETIIQLKSTSDAQLHEAYASQTNDNICVVGSKKTLCGNATSGYSQLNVDHSGATEFQVGNTLYINLMKKIDLGSLTITNRADIYTGNLYTNGLPKTKSQHLVYNAQGDAFFIEGNMSTRIIYIKTTGEEITLDDSTTWEKIIGVDQYGWVYGSGQLRRINLNTGTLEATNYLQDLGMLQVTDMSFSTGNKIRIDGTSSSGALITIYLDTQTGQKESSAKPLPKFAVKTIEL